MGCHYGFHDFAKGYLAQEHVVLFESHTSTARSFVLVSALWVVASWIPSSPRVCASTPLSPPALIFKRYNKIKPHPYEEGFGMWSWALFHGVRSRDIFRSIGKYASPRRPATVMWGWTTLSRLPLQTVLHKTDETSLAYCIRLIEETPSTTS